MKGEDLRDLSAFTAVAEEGSFTRAAARLGVSQSALSQTIRSLEERVGIRLFSRTTRSVSLTDAGERLFADVGPSLGEIDRAFASLSDLRDRPAGTIRITADEYAAHSVLWPAIEKFLPGYPDIRIELTTDYGRADIVSDRYDAGVRRGGLIAKDMIAVRIGPDVPMAVVGTPAYFERNPIPKSPRELVAHNCINLRLPTHGAFFTWTFRKGKQQEQVKVDGQLVFSSILQVRDAAAAGCGLAYLPLDYVRQEIERRQLVEVLTPWRQIFEGFHLYYPSRRQQTPALAAFVKAVRYRA
ncbi:LysR family transcriptional regulator [Sphingopyxis sp. 550A]